MIFPMREGNDLTDFMTMPYYDKVAQLVDPDPLGNWTLHDLSSMSAAYKRRFLAMLS